MGYCSNPLSKSHIAGSVIFDEIANQYLKVGRKAFSNEELQKRIEAISADADLFKSLEYDNNYSRTFEPHDAQMDALQVMTKLKSGNADQIAQAEDFEFIQFQSEIVRRVKLF